MRVEQRMRSRLCLPGLWLALSAGLALGSAGGAAAQQSEWVGIEETKARLIAAASAVDGQSRLDLGLQFRLARGWKTYWRSPGEAGMPAQLDWSGSENVAGVELLWPLPERFTAFDLQTYGYGGEVVLPIRLAVADPALGLSARVLVFYQVCHEICIPVEAELRLDLPAAGGGSSIHAATIARYLARVPAPEGGPFEFSEVRLDGAPGAQVLRFAIRGEAALEAPEILLEAPYPFGFGAPEIRLATDGKRAEVAVPVRALASDGTLAAHPVTVTLVDGARAGEKTLLFATH